MYCADCGKQISQKESLENDSLCFDCFEDTIYEAMEAEDEIETGTD
jgi:hypothetical protein